MQRAVLYYASLMIVNQLQRLKLPAAQNPQQRVLDSKSILIHCPPIMLSQYSVLFSAFFDNKTKSNRSQPKGFEQLLRYIQFISIICFTLHSGIVRRFLGDGNVVGMAFYEASGGDADEFAVYLELLNGSAAAVAHAAS